MYPNQPAQHPMLNNLAPGLASTASNNEIAYAPGDTVMAKSPAVNGQWAQCTIVQGTSGLLVQFPDNTHWNIQDVQLGGKVASPVEAAAPAPVEAHDLRPGHQAFLEDLLKIEGISRQIFNMPLESVLLMINRIAVQQSLPVSGTMDNIGGSVMCVPDLASFESWAVAYLKELEKREDQASAGQAE